jgi:DHA2 family methylenomycin A resistance protein-like MFS transporter
VLSGLLGGIGLLALFLASQRRGARTGRDVLLAPGILAAPRVLAGLLAGAVYNFSLYGMLIVLTFDFQQGRQFTPFETGLAFLPLTVVATVTSALLGGRFAHRFGPRAGIVVGMAICTGALASLSLSARSAPYALVAIGLAVFAFGQSLVAPAQTLAVMSFTPDAHKNMGSSALNTSRQAGGVVGVALLGAIATGRLSSGTSIALAIGLLACVLGGLGAIRLLPRHAPAPEPAAAPARGS